MLYKYRNLNDFRFFVDIVLNNRLFAASYTNLNDPMEGYYRYTTGELTEEILDAIKGEKQKLGICSLSRRNDIELMWSHYCDGHKGLVIGVEIDSSKYEITPIEYNGLSDISNADTFNRSYQEIAKSILTNKHNIWSYEEEVRAFVEGSNFIDVNVREIILGQKMDTRTQSFIRKLVGKINPDINIRVSNIYDI